MEYADVLGIPFDFTAKPVVAPPQPPRAAVLVRAVTPERDACEIRMETGAIVSVTVQDASDGNTATLPGTLIMAAEQVELVQPDGRAFVLLDGPRAADQRATRDVTVRVVWGRVAMAPACRGRSC